MKAVWSQSMRWVGLSVALGMLAFPAVAQDDEPLPSPKAMVQQVVGTEPITITYHSPGVKNRVIWGELVPYGEVWRAGANAKTTIEFSQDVRINGNPLEAGTYGFQILPSETSWELIFSDNPGANPMQRDPEHDVLTVTVTPTDAPFRERLAYEFDNMTDDSANIILHWEEKLAQFEVELGLGIPTFTGTKKEVFDVVKAATDKIKTQDIEGAMMYYADDFASDQGGGKAEYKEFLIGAKEQGFLEDMGIIMEDMEIEVDGEKAMVSNVEAEGAFGVLTLEFELEKRDGDWIVTYMAQY